MRTLPSGRADAADILAAITTVGAGWLSDRVGNRGLISIALMLVGIVGFGAFARRTHADRRSHVHCYGQLGGGLRWRLHRRCEGNVGTHRH